MMHSPPTTPAITSASTPSISTATTPATSHHLQERDDTPDRSPQKLPVLTDDFYLDTFFNPVWTPGPYVFALAGQGTVVRTGSYTIEPCPGYDTSRARHVVESISASHCQVFSRRDPKPWKNVAIMEQDDAEFAAFQERMRVGALGEWRPHPSYANANVQGSMYEPELVYTWPPKPDGW